MLLVRNSLLLGKPLLSLLVSLILQGMVWFDLENILFMQDSVAKFILSDGLTQERFDPPLDKWHRQDLVAIGPHLRPYVEHRLNKTLHLRRVRGWYRIVNTSYDLH